MSKTSPQHVIVLSTSTLTRGGISSVVLQHQDMSFWSEHNCLLIETHIDESVGSKIQFYIKALYKYIKCINHAKLVHVHTSFIISVLRKAFFIEIARLFGVKVVVHLHFSDVKYLYRYKNIYSYLFVRANAIIVLSESWKREILNFGTSGKPVYTVYNSVKDSFKRSTVLRSKVVLYAGYLSERKGCIDLVNAFTVLSSQHPEWELHFAGDGHMDQVSAIVAQNGMSDRIKFLGWLNNTEKQKVFNNASLLVLPSYSEGFPMVILEAWSTGLPTITTPVGGLLDFVKDGFNSLLVEIGNVSSLSSAINELIIKPDTREMLSYNAFQTYQTNFKSDVVSKLIDDIYKATIEHDKA